jgi:hypothetical protein
MQHFLEGGSALRIATTHTEITQIYIYARGGIRTYNLDVRMGEEISCITQMIFNLGYSHVQG